jgi:hypothetical protein
VLLIESQHAAVLDPDRLADLVAPGLGVKEAPFTTVRITHRHLVLGAAARMLFDGIASQCTARCTQQSHGDIAAPMTDAVADQASGHAAANGADPRTAALYRDGTLTNDDGAGTA